MNPEQYSHDGFPNTTTNQQIPSFSVTQPQISSTEYQPPLPPRRNPVLPQRRSFDQSEGLGQNYIRDPHKLIAYLVPFPKPAFRKGLLHASEGDDVPTRFLIYTPPPPPLQAPAEGEKEGKIHKVQRKWQEEVRNAKTSDAKVASWKGVKGRATKGISWAMGKTTGSNLDFVNRIPGFASEKDHHADDGHNETNVTHKTVGLEEMILIYPASVPGTEHEIRTEFISTMMRTKTKAQRDSYIATGLLPVAGAIDVLATLVWPFGGLLEIDAVWAAANIRGAKTARGVTKRLNSSGTSGNAEEDMLKLSFTPSPRLEILQRYLNKLCHDIDRQLFTSSGTAPTETEVLEAIGWSPSSTGGATRNWEDEQWETQEVKEDLKATMLKGAKEWVSWVKKFEKDPEKAIKK